MWHYLKNRAEKKKGLARHLKAILDLHLELEPRDFKRCQVSRSLPDEKRNLRRWVKEPYHRAHEIVGNSGLALEIVDLSVSCSTASGILRGRAEHTVRFARPNILFYDEHVNDLYHRTCGLYRMGRRYRNEGKFAQQSGHGKRRTRAGFCSAAISRRCCKIRIFLWWAHQGSNLGPAD